MKILSATLVNGYGKGALLPGRPGTRFYKVQAACIASPPQIFGLLLHQQEHLAWQIGIIVPSIYSPVWPLILYPAAACTAPSRTKNLVA